MLMLFKEVRIFPANRNPLLSSTGALGSRRGLFTVLSGLTVDCGASAIVAVGSSFTARSHFDFIYSFIRSNSAEATFCCPFDKVFPRLRASSDAPSQLYVPT